MVLDERSSMLQHISNRRSISLIALRADRAPGRDFAQHASAPARRVQVGFVSGVVRKIFQPS